MKLTAAEIMHKSFSRKIGGYDADEVSAFLQQVADEMDAIARERIHLKEIIRDKDLQMLEYKERDQALRETITTAHKLTENLRQDAEREAKLILNDARQRGEAIMRDARDSLKQIYEEIADLKRQKMRFEAEVRTLVRSHLELLEQNATVKPLVSASVPAAIEQGTAPAATSVREFTLSHLQFNDNP